MKREQRKRLRPLLLSKRALVFARRIEAGWADQRGLAAVKFGLFAIFLSVTVSNVTDDLDLPANAGGERTQVAVRAAWKACDLPKLPATTNCHGLATAIQNAMTSTSLGARISLVSGSPSEGYYSVNSSNALQYVSSVSAKSADCTAAGMPSLKPGDYIQVQTTFAYTPLFPGVSVASGFVTPISRTAIVRLG
jgi:hypothetical protein